MAIIIILITISLSIAILFLALFFWNMRSGQYDDTYTPGVRILFDNKASTKKNTDGAPGISGAPSHSKTN